MKPVVVIYHSVLGIRGSEQKLAEVIRNEGFDVIIPDLYDGVSFSDYESGMKYLASFGEDGLEKKALALFEAYQKNNGKRPVIFSGFSNGSTIAEWLSLRIAETVGTVLFHGGLPVRMYGYEAWPSRLPIQIYYMKQDPWRLEDEEYIQEFLEQIKLSGAKVDFFEYEGVGHLFTDPELIEEYHEQATKDAYKNVVNFLTRYQ